jgi:hypothetical protein
MKNIEKTQKFCQKPDFSDFIEKKVCRERLCF